MGFLLLIPPLRQVVGAKLIMKLVQSGNIRTNFGGGAGGAGHPGGPGGPGRTGGGQNSRRPGSGPIIDGDFEDVSPDDKPSSANDDKKDSNDPDQGPRNLPPHNS